MGDAGPVDRFGALPDPGEAGTLGGLVERLRLLKLWAGDPSYERIKDRVNTAWSTTGRSAGDLARRTTVADCFRPGRRRLNSDLVAAVVQALHPDPGYVAQWRQALRVIGGRGEAASQVRVQDHLPPDLPGFTGRVAELDLLRRALRRGRPDGDAVVVSAIGGMAGIGKTRLAVRAGHLLIQEEVVDRVFFVNLRGFHPDPAQPPADPGAVLDGFLRLLGMPGQQIPHDLAGRTAAYRRRLAGTRTLVVLDNAATARQVRPLLPGTEGCPVLVTSRRDLSALRPSTRLTVDVFSPGDALVLLAPATAGVPVGADPGAAARIARRCGHLPLALSLVAAHLRARRGWTLTDHADRLDERHQQHHLDTGVQLALDLSYRSLTAGEQRLLRLAALHPGQDLDPYAAAALTGTDLETAGAHLRDLCRHHLLQQVAADRYTFHDLVRAYATGRAGEEDPPAERRAAVTRLFDHYLAAAATAMDTLHPAESHRRPRVTRPTTPHPDLTAPDTARAWLGIERPTLVACVAAQGRPAHTTRFSITLHRYLDSGFHTDALTVHGHALRAARQTADVAGQAQVLNNLGEAETRLGHYRPAAEHLEQALRLGQRAGDRIGQAHTLINLGNLDGRLGRYRRCTDRYEQALALCARTGDRTGRIRALGHLGFTEARLGRCRPAAVHLEEALVLSREAGDRTREAWALNNLGSVAVLDGRDTEAAAYLREALTLYRNLRSRSGEAWTLDDLGVLHTRLGQPAQAAACHEQALAVFRDIGDRLGEAWTLNGLAETAQHDNRPGDALTHHTAAEAVAVDIGAPDQEARSHAGLGHAHRALADPARARRHYQHALRLYTALGTPEAEQVRTCLADV